MTGQLEFEASILSTFLLTILILAITLLMVRVRRWSIHLVSLAILIGLAIILSQVGLDLYPYNDVIVLGIALIGGSLLGRILWRKTKTFITVFSVVSLEDIASFVFGFQGGSASGTSQNTPMPFSFLNFSFYYGNGSHFQIGIIDLLFLSTLVVFFALRQFKAYEITVISIASMLSPYVFLLIVATSGGLPLTPFITGVCIIVLITRPNKYQTSSV